MTTEPTKIQLEQFITEDDSKPVQMLNLLKFKAEAEYGEGYEGPTGTGMEAYLRYGLALHQEGILESVNAEMIYSGPVYQGVIGDAGSTDFDMMAIVRYPSRAAFLEMTQSEAYQKAHIHRDAGLERQLLIATVVAE